ncbi:MAG: ATP-binding cassette domain-containing protein [Deltaproteobacteria bacterium]|nr:ATP-binding cassette domain-containing protein [Deltaproteobacteria bacterium]
MTLELKKLSRRFGEFRLDAIDLRVERGEYWAVLGPSGAGKSLLLETLVGAYTADSGGIWLDGDDITWTPPEARDFGLVFQSAALFPHFGVERNIGYGLAARKVDAAERARRVATIVRSLGIEGLLERPVGALSGGEAQRVAIARALVIEPRLMLLDEPLSLLDHNARIELQRELKRLHDEFRLTTIHVTHSREEAVALSTHCAVMFGGRILQAGPTADVFGRPVTREVAKFLGRDAESSSTRA